MRKLVVCGLLAVMSVFGAGVGGNWKGNAYRPDGTPSMDVLLMVKEEAEKVTGTVGPTLDEQIPISNAKVAGDKFTFEVVTDNAVYKVSVTVAGDEITGSAVRTEGGQDSPPMKIALKRSK